MTSEARKQAWLAAHRVRFCYPLHDKTWWKIESSTGRELRLIMEDRTIFVVSPRSKPRDGLNNLPRLKGLDRLLLSIVPPDMYAAAFARSITRNHAQGK